MTFHRGQLPEPAEAPYFLLVDYGSEGWGIVGSAGFVEELLPAIGETYGSRYIVAQALEVELVRRVL